MSVTLSTRTPEQQALWDRIAAHPFEPSGQALTFTARFARDHGWDLATARAAVEEYRRFCFLAVTAGTEMTPSEEIDEVWHQHLTYSRDYWERWCGDVLRKRLHHQPTQGGAAEAGRFADQYARTLAAYEAAFGPPDPAYWPGTARRFGRRSRFTMVDRDRALIVPLPAVVGHGLRRLSGSAGLAAVLSLLPGRPAAAASLGVLDWTAQPFLTLYATLAVLALGSAWAFDLITRERADGRPAPGDLGPIDLALLSGGLARAADVIALQLLEARHLVLADGRLARRGAAEPPPQLAPVLGRMTEPVRRKDLVDLMWPRLERPWRRLAGSGLALSLDEITRIRLVTACLVTPVAVLGVCKIGVGLSRGKPVGFLAMLVIATVIGGLIFAATRRLATAAGAMALADFRSHRARAVRAPMAEEVITAFAIAGPVALVGTALAGYAGLMQNSGGTGCGAGGCGGGGGGCGGCGGS